MIERDSPQSMFAVKRNKVKAMNPVAKHTSIPSSKAISTKLSPGDGIIHVTLMPESSLEKKWDRMNQKTNEFVCCQLWAMFPKIWDIPRPLELIDGPFQCMVDGSQRPVHYSRIWIPAHHSG